jgi:hypothetical protein
MGGLGHPGGRLSIVSELGDDSAERALEPTVAPPAAAPIVLTVAKLCPGGMARGISVMGGRLLCEGMDVCDPAK